MGSANVPTLTGVAIDQTTQTRREEGLSTGGLRRLDNNLQITCWIISILLVVGLAFTIIEVGAQFSAGILWALACFSVGCIGGFLFAIPRVPKSSLAPKNPGEATSSSDTKTQLGASAERGFGLGINTNLEEISDWLTKILVGLGLIQLRSLPENIRRVGDYVGQGLSASQRSVASGIVIYFLGLGFLTGYLLTRMFLSPAFRLADQATTLGLEEQIQETHALAIAAQAQSQAADERSAVNSDVETAVGELSKPDRPPARIDQLITTLRQHIKVLPLHRKLNIVLARLYAEGAKNPDEAIKVLQEFIARKVAAKEGQDFDTADAFFNIACYYSEKMKGKTGEERAQLEHKGFEAISKSVNIFPANAKDILVDKDMAELAKTDRVVQLARSTNPN